MGLMGYVRSGLREDWHIYGVLRDTSPYAYTPTMAYMAKVVGVIVLLFLSLITFVFWLTELGEQPPASAFGVPVESPAGNPGRDGPALGRSLASRAPAAKGEAA